MEADHQHEHVYLCNLHFQHRGITQRNYRRMLKDNNTCRHWIIVKRNFSFAPGRAVLNKSKQRVSRLHQTNELTKLKCESREKAETLKKNLCWTRLAMCKCVQCIDVAPIRLQCGERKANLIQKRLARKHTANGTRWVEWRSSKSTHI